MSFRRIGDDLRWSTGKDGENLAAEIYGSIRVLNAEVVVGQK